MCSHAAARVYVMLLAKSAHHLAGERGLCEKIESRLCGGLHSLKKSSLFFQEGPKFRPPVV